MENFPVNPADLAVIAVLLLAALLAFTRGLVAEVLSVAAWAGAAVVTLYALPHVLPFVQAQIKLEMVAYAVTAVGLYIVSLVVLTLVGRALSRGVQNSGLSALDRSLGFVFGLAKGAILVSVAYLFFVWLVPNTAEHPVWLQTAKTRPFLANGAAMLYDFVPETLRKEGVGQMDIAREQAKRAMEAKEALDRLSTPVPSQPKTGGASQSDTGYKDRDRAEIERLMQNAR
ncbi:CvpA family protein [Azospirillum agricola]|uniref:CvpA family protein n=1 Tax=Azospirillum agricola TaxID=1720247 RepID=UPI000A0F3901|nr:CvpA family protein [Azospirillum agricola]MBP2227437.1 membrane protein required for colicin V production [Azospirillum agricola]SMH59729.1 membrane protein required for colicin V production [Azospirillum lipoferum]